MLGVPFSALDSGKCMQFCDALDKVVFLKDVVQCADKMSGSQDMHFQSKNPAQDNTA